MRPRYQEGSIQRRGNQWVLKFWHDKGGKRVRTVKPLAPFDSHPFRSPLSETDHKRLRVLLADQIAAILSPVNQGRSASGIVSLADFIEQSYFPRLQSRFNIPAGNELHIEPTTIQGYHYAYQGHIRNNPIAKTPLINFTPQDARRLMESVSQTLSHRRHLRIKNFLSGVFSWAIEDGAFKGPNPMDQIKVGGQTGKTAIRVYTLAEVADMIDQVREPAKTLIAVASLTGLSHSELPGLKWSDYDGEYISVQRKVTGRFDSTTKKVEGAYIGPTKTTARQEKISVVPQLRKILVKYKKEFPPGQEDWMFTGSKLSQPINLDNLVKRDIQPFVNGLWKGWHPFRHAIGSRLNEMGVDFKTIQKVLRHASSRTTEEFYILPNRAQTDASLKKFSRAFKLKD